MKKVISILLILLMAVSANSQIIENSSKLNLDFEKVENGFPLGWKNFGAANYSIQLDSNDVISGKYSAQIEFKAGNVDFKALGFTLPNNYDGKVITLSGYIKTENVKEGYAGLWMNIDPLIASDNMRLSGITGTTDWKKYKISLNMNPKKTTQIVVGGILQGKGKMWVDNLQISIDGNDIVNLNPYVKEVIPAEIDKEFDNGSRISNITLRKRQIDNLKKLGLVWGFVKYYHPNVSAGKFNMDYELFRILPDILNAKNNNEINNVLSKWLDHFGQYEIGKEPEKMPLEIKFTPDLKWINNSGFSVELTNKLQVIEKANRLNVNYYVELSPSKGNPSFNENPYQSFKVPDEGFRLLSVYRYWNIIQYFFPSKYLIGEDWENVLVEFIPKFIKANDETEYTLVCLELIGRVHDTHANIWGWSQPLNIYRGINYLPVKITFIDNNAVVSGFVNNKLGKETGLEMGDLITKINNKRVDAVVKKNLKYAPASNYPRQLRYIASNLLRTNDSTMNIELIRDGIRKNRSIKTIFLDLNDYSQTKDTCFKIISNDIAYINIETLQSKYLPKIWVNFQKAKGLIIDLRSYPYDAGVYYGLSKYLMPKGVPYYKATFGSIEFPGRFYITPAISIGQDNNNSFKGRIVIMVNEETMSNAEFQAMVYRAVPNAIVIGSTTAGADGDVSEFTLPGGIHTMFSGVGIYCPDGKETQRIGIVPDIVVRPSIEGIKNGKDELLEKAIELINSK